MRILRPLAALLFAAVLCAILPGCSALNGIVQNHVRFEDVRYDKPYGKMWELLLAALDSGDKEALQSLFSDDTAGLPGFEDQLDELLNFYEGQSVESVNTGGVEQGIPTDYVEKNYSVTTDNNAYSVSFCYTLSDPEFEEKPENAGKISSRTGLNSVLIMTGKLAEEARYTQWPPSDGVFILRAMEDCDLGGG